MKLKRLIYLGYYLKESDYKKLLRFTTYAKTKTGRSTVFLWLDMISSAIKYNVSFLDYFHFRFYELTSADRSTYAGTGFMYEYQRLVNPNPHREVLENKIIFLERFRQFVRRRTASVATLKHSPDLTLSFLAHSSGKLVLKGSRGQVGAEVKVVRTSDFVSDTLVNFMTKHGLDLVEEFVVQHPELMRLSPSGLNTVRIFTHLANNEIIFLGARLRVTINSEVDNMAAGNVAVPLDMQTGEVVGPGVFSDITRPDIDVHPITGQSLIGFKVPFWNETLSMIEEAVRVEPGNKSVGWDIAITPAGPELIEGNHNWCKLLWQMPVHKGLKSKITELL